MVQNFRKDNNNQIQIDLTKKVKEKQIKPDNSIA